jgi:endoglucanase
MSLLFMRRRDVLVGLGASALLSATGSLPLSAQQMQGSLAAQQARRLMRGLSASFWFEWLPSSDPVEIKKRIENWYQPRDFAQIHSLGFDHIRVSIQPNFLAPKLDSGDADLDAERMEIFDSAMKSILDNGLALVLDNHAQSAVKDKIATNDAYRTLMAQWWRNFAGYVVHQGQYGRETTFFEMLNEPEQSFDDIDRYRTTMGQFISSVRASAPDYTVIAGGNRWNIAEAIYDGLKTPFSDGNLIYSFHFYLPLDFTHQGLENAGPYYAKLKNVPWEVGPGAMTEQEIASYDPSVQEGLRQYNQKSHRKSDLQWAFDGLKQWCDSHGQVAWLGEFGVYVKKANPEQRADWIRDVRELAEEHGFGWAMWEARGGFGLFEGDSDARPLKVETSVLKALGL